MLWELLKTLNIKNCPIYIDKMTEDKNSTPKNFIVIEETSYNHSYVQGDGQDIARMQDWNIRFYGQDKNVILTALKLVTKELSKNYMQYSVVGPTWDPSLKEYIIVISGDYICG